MYTQSLNFRSLGERLLVRVLGLHLPPNHKFPDIVLLCQSEELANLARSFRPQTFGVSHVRETGELAVALLDDNDRQDRKIGTDDTSANGLAFSLSIATGTVT